MQQPTIAIIGAGASGLGVAKALREAGVNFEIIEATARFGGNWQPDGPASKMYASVHLISSRRNTQFADFPMPADYPDYPRHNQVFAYLTQLAEHYQLAAHTRFNTRVTHMAKDRQGWQLTFADGSQSRYAVVVVCNGLLGVPKIPAYPGTFSGPSLHARDYRSAEQLRGKRVLVVGGGNSGCDIAVDAAQTASRALHSTRRGYHYMPKFIDGQPTQEWLMDQAPKFSDEDAYWAHVERSFKFAGFDGRDYGLPAPDHGIRECHPILNSQVLYYIGHGDLHAKPDISRFDGQQVHFSDGSVETIDLIVWATGYGIDLPFLPQEVFDWKREFDGLFMRMLPAEHDDLMFVGYLNTPSGIGNLANMTGRFIAACIQARAADSPAWRQLQQIKLAPERLDLGQQRFMQTQRHAHEVDLWKFIRTLNFLTARLQTAQPLAHSA
ncbi:flavin-containing monooxygenase [Pseudomonas sp. 5P_5.1_Bac1]|uniref:flavin-containing monooxygenase n=1 Tax=Pseudomonas sp. 5P_5.1_Bac1 TaxID=2971616 RepID=UPI0021C9A5D2|nr:NAD(P)-binding domain-containing protein [Pseudomonas sp. 5P_5.1_Bac1]MCU1723768.1 NAD(P)-binding domain-containing protein [Pseudomonas sp. 5P_5.1_Bac1]